MAWTPQSERDVAAQYALAKHRQSAEEIRKAITDSRQWMIDNEASFLGIFTGPLVSGMSRGEKLFLLRLILQMEHEDGWDQEAIDREEAAGRSRESLGRR